MHHSPTNPLPPKTIDPAFSECASNYLPWYATVTLVAACSPQASAAVIEFPSGYSTPVNGSVWFDFNHGSSGTGVAPAGAQFALSSSFFSYPGYSSKSGYLNVRSSTAYVASNSGYYNYARKLKGGVQVGPLSFLGYPLGGRYLVGKRINYQGIRYDYGQWKPGETGFAGLQFNLSDGSTHYGWAEVTLNANYTETLDEFGYETAANTPITLPGTVPDSGSTHSLLLIAMGAVGLAAYRARRPEAAG